MAHGLSFSHQPCLSPLSVHPCPFVSLLCLSQCLTLCFSCSVSLSLYVFLVFCHSPFSEQLLPLPFVCCLLLSFCLQVCLCLCFCVSLPVSAAPPCPADRSMRRNDKVWGLPPSPMNTNHPRISFAAVGNSALCELGVFVSALQARGGTNTQEWRCQMCRRKHSTCRGRSALVNCMKHSEF